jgi:hypothetical protein
MIRYGGVDVWIQGFSLPRLEVSVQINTSATPPPGKEPPRTHWRGG